MKKLSIILIVFGMLVPIRAEASSLQNSFMFKCTVIEQGVEYEWEFSSPDEFEVEKGNVVRKGSNAKKDVIALYDHLQVTELSRVEELVKKVENYGYENASRFELRWMDANGRLFTWVWDKTDSE